MRAIAEPFYGASELMSGPLLALLLFTAMFVVILVRAVRRPAVSVDREAALALGGEPSARPRSPEEPS